MDTVWEGIIGNQASLWFAIGFALLAIEILAFGFGSGVLLFASLGALVTGGLLWLDAIPQVWVYSIACFAVASALVTALLWAPFKRLQSGAELGNDRSSDLIGYQFRLDGDLSRTQEASHKFSGVPWRVQLSEDSATDAIASGSRVRVSAVNAGVFVVVPDEA